MANATSMPDAAEAEAQHNMDWHGSASSPPDGSAIAGGMALCLSGGGYRAMLFHLGGLWRLNELGWLPKLNCVSGVSGGAILAGWYGLRWRDVQFDSDSVATNFQSVIADPLRALTSRVLDIPAGLVNLALPTNALARGLAQQLFGAAKLSDLANGLNSPRTSVLSTNLLTGSNVEFTREGVDDERLGFAALPELPLAVVVAASCSIPPTFRPVSIRVRPEQWQGGERGLERIRQHAIPLRLVDGGNYDNLALHRVWNRYATLLVSDGSSPMPPWGWVSGDWLTATLRSNRILIDRLRQASKRELIGRRLGDPQWPQDGAYWGITSEISGFGLSDTLCADSAITHTLARMRTRLGRHTPEEQGRLINWGYALCDAALRAHLQPQTPKPQSWPVPTHAL